MSEQAGPVVAAAVTVQIECGCGPLYCILNFDEEGRLFRMLARLGKAGGCAALYTEVTAALVSEALAAGASPERLIECVRGTQCHMANPAQGVASCGEAFARALARGAQPPATQPLPLDEDSPEPQRSLP